MNNDCIFCKIAGNRLPSRVLYEDDLVMAFLDVHPISSGHLLVISKDHVVDAFDASDDLIQRIGKVCKTMGLLCKDKLEAGGVNIMNASGKSAQQSVPHLHFHVVPRWENDGLDLWFQGAGNNEDELDDVYKKLTS